MFPRTRLAALLFLLPPLLLSAALVTHRLVMEPFPFWDRAGYLEAAGKLREAGGPFRFVSLYLTGTYREANRNPLPLVLFASLGERGPATYVRAKLLCALAGLLAVLAVLAAASRALGRTGGVLAAGLVGCSGLHVVYSGEVRTEPFLVLFGALLWSLAARAPRDPRLWGPAGGIFGMRNF